MPGRVRYLAAEFRVSATSIRSRRHETNVPAHAATVAQFFIPLFLFFFLRVIATGKMKEEAIVTVARGTEILYAFALPDLFINNFIMYVAVVGALRCP